MNKDKQELLNQVNKDIIFFFLLVVSAGISFYVINEKKKSILGIDCIDNDTANKIYYYNRRLSVIIAIYFLLNAYNNYITDENPDNKNQDKFLLLATTFNLLGSLFYLPLGNSNVIIDV